MRSHRSGCGAPAWIPIVIGQKQNPISCGHGEPFLTRPWIDEVYSSVFEVTSVSRGQYRLAGGGDTGNLYVPDFDRSTGSALSSGDFSRGMRRSMIERQNATTEVFLQSLG